MVQLKPVDGTDVFLWKYLPSVAAACIFIGLYAVATSAVCWRIYKTRCWFCVPFAIGGLCQLIGYGVRIYSHYNTNQIASYAIQSCFILIAPVFYAASIYMVLSRLIRSVHGERFSIIRPTRLTKIFVWGDFLSLNVQGDGAGLTANRKLQKIGTDIVIVGLFLQLVMFGVFVVTAAVFHTRMRRYLAKEVDSRPNIPWRQGLKMLYACSTLIILRSVFRAIEYIMGMDGFLLAHEWPMYVFDAVPMFAVQVIFFVWFPDKVQMKKGASNEDGFVLMGHGTQSR